MSKKEETYEPLQSSEAEEYCLSTIATILEKNPNNEKEKAEIKKEMEILENFIKSVWVLRTELHREIMSYNMLHEIKFFFDNKEKYENNWIKIPTSNRTVSFNLKDRKISILNLELEKTVDINIKDKMSDTLYEFVCKFFNYNVNLDLEKLGTEEFKVEKNIDLSGF